MSTSLLLNHTAHDIVAENSLHPGETPLEYRDRIGHVSNDPRTWGDLNKNQNTGIIGATYCSTPCGCRVVGNGTLPYPLTVLFCEDHAPPDPREVRYTVVLHIDIAGKRCDLTVGQFTDAAFVVALAFRLGHATIFHNATPMATVQSYVISLTDDATEEIVRASVAL